MAGRRGGRGGERHRGGRREVRVAVGGERTRKQREKEKREIGEKGLIPGLSSNLPIAKTSVTHYYKY